MLDIHPTAIVEKGAKLGNGVIIEPYAIVKKNVVLHDHVHIKSHAYIDGYTEIGEHTVVWPSAVIGTKSQDKKYKGEITYVKIGKRCEIREFATINSSTGEGSSVVVGDECLIMTYCHIAHNCKVGKGVVMSNNATLAGHVSVGDYAIIGGMTPIHQFSRVGQFAMVGGMSRITHDVPPYSIGGGVPYKLGGINHIGLKRYQVSLEVRQALTKAFRLVYRSGLHLRTALSRIEREVTIFDEVKEWLEFCQTSHRGLIALPGTLKQEERDSELESNAKRWVFEC